MKILEDKNCFNLILTFSILGLVLLLPMNSYFYMEENLTNSDIISGEVWEDEFEEETSEILEKPGSEYYWISFDFNGLVNPNGHVREPWVVKKEWNKSYGTLPLPEWRGYTFLNWNTKQDGSGEVIKVTTNMDTRSDHTLYAIWEESKFDIRYNLNGGRFKDNNYTEQYSFATGAVVDSVPVLEDYVFNGWCASGCSYSYNIPSHIFNGYSLSATWCKACEKVENGQCILDATTAGKCFYKTKCQDGYDLINEGRYNASCKAKELKLSFDFNGNGDEIVSKNVTYNEYYGELPIPKNPGYRFKGWTYNLDGGNIIYESSIVDIVNDSTLYAVWEGASFEVKLDAVGGSILNNIVTVKYNESYGELPKPKKRNFDFLGWFKDIDYNEEITNESIYDISENSIIYAKWGRKFSYEVLSENNITVYNNDENNIVLKIDADINDLQAVQIDNLILEPNLDYIVDQKESNVIVNSNGIKKIKELGHGEHDVYASFSYNSAHAKVNFVDKEKKTIISGIIMDICTLLAIMVLVIVIVKKARSKE